MPGDQKQAPLDLGGTVWESDLDLVLVMDALTDGPLTRTLFAAVGSGPPGAVKVARSVYRATDGRETDVLIEADAGSLLVENKIVSSFQVNQPASYEREVRWLRETGNDAWAVLVCPDRHTANLRGAGGDVFDASVTIEQLLVVVEGSIDRMDRAAASVLRKAVRQMPRRLKDFDPSRSAWGDAYRALVADLAAPAPFTVGPDGLRREAGRDAWYVSSAIKDIGYLGHRIEAGAVEATLNGKEPDPLTLPEGAAVSSRHTVRMSVPSMTFSRAPEDQQDELRMVLDAVRLLWMWLLDQAS